MEQDTLSLRSQIAELLGKNEEDLCPETPLNSGRLHGSIGRAVLASFIRRRFGQDISPLPNDLTLGTLEGFLSGSQMFQSPAPSCIQATVNVLPSCSGIGIDIECIENLPICDDYWENPFYHDHFTPQELAWCLTQIDPRGCLTAHWCCKEALRKADPQFAQISFTEICIIRDESGGWHIEIQNGPKGEWRRIPHLISMAYTKEFAVSIVFFPGVRESTDRYHETLPSPSLLRIDEERSSLKSAIRIPVFLYTLVVLVLVMLMLVFIATLLNYFKISG